jgi:hypothetical protein
MTKRNDRSVDQTQRDIDEEVTLGFGRMMGTVLDGRRGKRLWEAVIRGVMDVTGSSE